MLETITFKAGLARGIKKALTKPKPKIPSAFGNAKPTAPKPGFGSRKPISQRNQMGRDFVNQDMSRNIIGKRRETYKTREEAKMFSGIKKGSVGPKAPKSSSGRNIDAGYKPKRKPLFGFGRRKQTTSRRRQLI